MPRITPAQREQLVHRYVSGERTSPLAKEFGLSVAAIHGLLERRGVAVRPQTTEQRKCTINELAFDALTPDSEYWCGFIQADGHISRRRWRSPEIAVALAEQDRDHLEKLRLFLGSSHAIIHIPKQPNDAYRLCVGTSHLIATLDSLGVKTDILCPRLLSSRHFWRGVVDGDGSIGRYRAGPQLRLVGRSALLIDFVQFLNDNGIPTQATARPHKSIYAVGLTGKYATAAMRLLYIDPPTALTRKVNAALNIAVGHTVTARRGIALAEPMKREPQLRSA